MKKAALYVALVLAISLIAAMSGLNGSQVLSVAVFVSFIVGTLLYWPFRLAFALTGIAVLLASGLLDIAHLIEFASLDVILFLIGMMIIIGYLENNHFFEAALEKILPFIGGSAKKLMVSLMALSFISAALVDEVTSILFMAAITLRLCRHYKLDPIPYIIMVVFATNIGSGATVVGNPIGVLIALRAGLAFPDFLRWATPIAVVAWALTVVLSFVFFRKPMARLQEAIDRSRQAGEEMAAAAEDGEERPAKSGNLLLPSLIFLGTIVGLLSHKNIEQWLNLEHNVMLVGTALLGAGIVLFIERNRARELVEKRVDWWTLAFFMLLFASAGTLRYVGVTEHIAKGMINFTGGEIVPLMWIVTWGIGLLSAFMDNVLAVASFIPIVGDMVDAGINVFPLWWAMLFGGTILGNLTVIGSTANIIAVGLLERREGKGISFMEWFWPGLVTAVPSLLAALLLLLAQLPLLLAN